MALREGRQSQFPYQRFIAKAVFIRSLLLKKGIENDGRNILYVACVT